MAKHRGPNPKFHLTKEQTTELRVCWQPARALVDDSKDRLIQLKLANPAGATLTQRQLFLVAATLAGLDMHIPAWVFPMIEQGVTA